jgi:hypothetical protein
LATLIQSIIFALHAKLIWGESLVKG